MKMNDDSCFMVNNEIPLYRYFNEKTSLNRKSRSIFEKSIAAAFDDKKYERHTLKTTQKTQRKKDAYLLNVEYKDNEFEKTILNRKSIRDFSYEPLKYMDFCKLLNMSYGINEHGKISTPSAGGIYEIKLIVVINNVDDIKKGIYLYDINSNSLLPLVSEFTRKDYKKITYSLTLAEKCAFSIHAITNPTFMTYKYGDRGYRFLNLECGHIFQNLSLVATYLNIGSVCSGGFAEKDFIEYLDWNSELDFHNYMVLYEGFFGKEDN